MSSASSAPPEASAAAAPRAVPDRPKAETAPASTLSQILSFLGLWGLAVAEPLFEQLRTHTVFIHDSHTPREFLWMCVAAFSVGIPVGLGLLAALIGRISPRTGQVLLQMLLVVAWTLLLLQVVHSWALYVICVALPVMTAGAMWLTGRSALFRQGLQVLAIGAIIFPALFVAGTPVQSLLFPKREPSASQTAGAPVPVVMIVFDEFSGPTLWTPDRTIDAKLFPNFAALAGESRWYRNATSVHSATGFAVPSLLSGMYPPLPPAEAFIPDQTLFTTLIDQNGYGGLVLEPVTRLCVTSKLPEINSGRTDPFDGNEFLGHLILAYAHQVVPVELLWRKVLPNIDEVWFGVTRPTVSINTLRGVARYPWSGPRPIQLQHFLNGLRPAADSGLGNQPSLYFLHAVLPHIPWSQDAHGHLYTAPESLWDFPRPAEFGLGYQTRVPDAWPNDPLFVVQCQWRYLWQVQYADKFIGQVRARLLETGLYDKCLLVVMADHGVSFRAGDRRRTATSANQVDIISIPLFIKLPGERTGRVIDEPVESIDVFPTILDVLQVKDPPRTDGRSLIRPGSSPRPSKRFVNMEAGLQILSPDFPARVPASDWPVTSSLITSRIAERGDPGRFTGRSISEFELGQPFDCRLERLPGVTRNREKMAGTTLYLAGRIRLAPAPAPGQPVERSPPAAPLTLALALDDKIVCVTRTFLQPPEADLFQILLPAEQHPKSDRATLFVVESVGGKTVLRPCPWPE